jgi:hypothetical protein
MRASGSNPLVRREISQFPCEERTHMPGSPTTPGRSDTRAIVSDRIAFRVVDRVGTQDIPNYAAQWLAYAHPCRRFACILADADARLGVVAGHYSFNVADFHRLLLASLLAHRQSGWWRATIRMGTCDTA